MSAAQNSTSDFVVGLGATGMSIARYLHRKQQQATFFDTRTEPPGIDELRALFPDAQLLLGNMRLPSYVDRVIASPGISDSHPIFEDARLADVEVVSDIELFVREAEAPFIAVTGSNGKSTVTTLLYHMCRAAGRTAYAGGNLGEPALDLLDKPTPDLYVLELSSFHLQRTQNLPAAVSVLLNVTPDHLDWHASEQEYFAAKYRIFREARAAVYNRADPAAERAASRIKRRVSFGEDEPAEGQFGLREDNGETFLAFGEKLLLATDELAMYGRHNQLNALAALAAGSLAGLSPAAMLTVLCEFPGLSHRMEHVRRFASVDFVNDSKATNVAAAVASIRSVDGSLVLIAGGDGKGGDFSQLSAALEDKLRAAVLIGKDAQAIADALDTVSPVYFADDMQDAVISAESFAEPEDTVLLAPACASLDQYKNYMARGDAFAEAVWELRE
ncbi:MAG: UDP-N-acetylmuramoyl-L-alanine--D-glutamate ligase [Pseudomonadota bacterium]